MTASPASAAATGKVAPAGAADIPGAWPTGIATTSQPAAPDTPAARTSIEALPRGSTATHPAASTHRQADGADTWHGLLTHGPLCSILQRSHPIGLLHVGQVSHGARAALAARPDLAQGLATERRVQTGTVLRQQALGPARGFDWRRGAGEKAGPVALPEPEADRPQLKPARHGAHWLSPSGSHAVLLRGGEPGLNLCSMPQGETLICVDPAAHGTTSSTTWGEDAHLLAAGSGGRTVYLWDFDAASAQALQFPGPVQAQHFVRQDGALWATSGRTAWLQDFRARRPAVSIEHLPGLHIASLTCDQAASRVALVSTCASYTRPHGLAERHTLRVYDVGTGRPLFTVEQASHGTWAAGTTPRLSLSWDGGWLAALDHQSTCRIYDTCGRPVFAQGIPCIRSSPPSCRSLAWAPQRRTLAIARGGHLETLDFAGPAVRP